MFGFGKPARPKVVAFDIIETVFDLAPLGARLEALGLPASLLQLVFAESLRDAMALACADGFAPFADVMKSVIRRQLAQHGLSCTHDELADAMSVMRRLPPQPGAKRAFEMVRDAGIRIFALSNGAASATRALIEAAGMEGLVQHVVSVDDVRRSKPRAEPYRHAVDAAGVKPAELMLVAVHPWDTNGAKMAGLSTGYVCRGVPFPHTIMAAPDVEGDDLVEVARAIIGMAQ